MAEQLEIPFKPTNQIWRTYKHFPYKAWYAVGELVDNSTQSFLENRAALEPALAAKGLGLQVTITLDTKAKTLTVTDNAMGMDLDELKRAVQLAAPPPNTSGRSEFGMGLKTACSWLGNRWSVRTKKHGMPHEYSFEVDIDSHADSKNEMLLVTKKNVDDLTEHYTIVTVHAVRGDVVQGRTISRIKRHLAEMYRRDIAEGTLTLLWDTQTLVPPDIEILQTEFEVKNADGSVRTELRQWRKDIEFDVKVDPETGTTQTVSGWVCVIAPPGGRKKAGFDLVRRGRVIIGRPGGFRPETIFGEARNDLINQRLYGELNLDDFPVNHLKDDFLWDTWGEEFEAKLETACSDYSKKAREARSKGTISPAIVQTTNDEIAESLNTEELATRINLLETVGPTPPAPPEVRQAEAEILRNQPMEPRVIEHMGKTYRIYHPQNMLPEQPYVRFEGPDAKAIDIFINDNHPHISTIGDSEGGAEKYLMHAQTCVIDAIVAHILSGLGKPVDPAVFLLYKDQLMRVMTA